MSGADDYEHALGGLRGHIVYGEQTAGDTPIAWVQVKVALPYLRDAERALVAERTRADAAEEALTRLRSKHDAARQAHAELASAVREYRDAVDDACIARGSEDAGLDAAFAVAEREDDAARAVDALLAAAPPRSTVPARLVREYLAAEASWREGIGAYLPGEDVTAYVARRDVERARVNELHSALWTALAGCA